MSRWGDVDIKVIGADSQVLDSEVPVRQILEQLVARTGIPPFLLGLSWSSTERMSTQQADMMTSELTAIRRGLEPVVERICELWLALHGYDRRVTGGLGGHQPPGSGRGGPRGVVPRAGGGAAIGARGQRGLKSVGAGRGDQIGATGKERRVRDAAPYGGRGAARRGIGRRVR